MGSLISNVRPNVMTNVRPNVIVPGEPVATITTTKVGTFSMLCGGAVGDTVVVNPGDGSGDEIVVLNGSGYGQEVTYSHTFSSGTHVVRIKKPYNLVRFQLVSQSIVSVNLEHAINLYLITIYNSKTSGFSDFGFLSSMSSLGSMALNINNISDISPLNDLPDVNSLIAFQAYNNSIVDISPLSRFPNLNTIYMYINRLMKYPEPDALSGIGIPWPIRHKGNYDFHDSMKTVLHPDWMLNDINASGWDNSAGTNSVNLTTTHAVTALSDTSRAALASRGVSLTVDIGDLLVVQGDSISTAEDWPSKMNNVTWNSGYRFIKAIPGQKVSSMAANYDGIDSLYLAPSGYSGYYFIMGGCNDIKGTPGRSSAEIIADLESIYSRATVDYTNLCAIHVLPSVLITGDLEAIRNEVNAFISASTDVDTVVTVPALLSDPSDTDYYVDGTHLTALGSQVLADAIETAMGW